MKALLKTLASHLPRSTQQALKRLHFRRQLRKSAFVTDEPEFEYSSAVLRPGDWVLDIGANIGHYTLEFSRLVGPEGRVIAFEPIADTFELLAANVSFANAPNVTLLNLAASDTISINQMEIPKFATGLDNFYMARISGHATGIPVLCLPIDSLNLPSRVRLAKIDAEGHDFAVLKGMHQLLKRDQPMLFVEEASNDLREFLESLGYCARRLAGSHNTIFEST